MRFGHIAYTGIISVFLSLSLSVGRHHSAASSSSSVFLLAPPSATTTTTAPNAGLAEFREAPLSSAQFYINIRFITHTKRDRETLHDYINNNKTATTPRQQQQQLGMASLSMMMLRAHNRLQTAMLQMLLFASAVLLSVSWAAPVQPANITMRK